MVIVNAHVEKSIELENQIFLLKIRCPEIATKIKPGEFLNVRVSETMYPLLRRPFSVCDVEGDFFYLMFNVFGEGTKILARKHYGETIDVLGPLGHGFNLEGNYDTAVVVAGGLGAAPFPYLIRELGDRKNVLSFVGGRTHKDVITYGMNNISVATEDGSLGFEGNVVQLLNKNLDTLKSQKIKVFSCGPNPMMKAVQDFCLTNGFDGEISTECAMACGFGICQGCPIQSTEKEDKYHLVCKDGPVFNVKDVVL